MDNEFVWSCLGFGGFVFSFKLIGAENLIYALFTPIDFINIFGLGHPLHIEAANVNGRRSMVDGRKLFGACGPRLSRDRLFGGMNF